MSRKARPSEIRVAISQLAGKLNATSENMVAACRISREAAQDGASLILFPEGCLNGNAFNRKHRDSLAATPESFTPLREVADVHNITICIGFLAPVGEKFNNAFAIIRPGNETLFQYKCARTELEPDFLMAWQDEARTVFSVCGVRMVVVICCEYGNEQIDKRVALAQPDLILHPSAGHEKDDQPGCKLTATAKQKLYQKFRSIVDYAAAQTSESDFPRVSANPLGFDGETWWPGNSYALSGDGEILLWMKGVAFSEAPQDMRHGIVDIPIRPEPVR